MTELHLAKSSQEGVLCSIIFCASTNSAQAFEYLSFLDGLGLSQDHEIFCVNKTSTILDEGRLGQLQLNLKVVDSADVCNDQTNILDHAASLASGSYILFVLAPVTFNKEILHESIEELCTCQEKLSVSSGNTFVLVEKAYLLNAGGFERLFRDETQVDMQLKTFPGLDGEKSELKYPKSTFIDPDVVIDHPEKIKIGANCKIRKGVILRPEGGEIVIGDNCVINHYTIIHAKGGVYIGNWSIIAPHCGLYAQNHSFDSFEIPITKQPNVGKGIYLMGDNWLGSHAVICDDVTLGKGAVVGANSTVTRSIPMASVAAGAPAKVIRERFSANWDFHNRERASIGEMSESITTHVLKRGELICEFIEGNDNVLDVGSGEGFITSLVGKKCSQVTGCDYSAQAVQIASEKYTDIRFTCCNTSSLPFEDECFSKVILSDVAEHLMKSQFVKSLIEIHRVLKPSGHMILATPITGNGKNTSTYAHIYEYSQTEIEQIISSVFCDVRLIDNNFGLFIAGKR